jgi:ABC-type histidine transport system ATPase subunit
MPISTLYLELMSEVLEVMKKLAFNEMNIVVVTHASGRQVAFHGSRVDY